MRTYIIPGAGVIGGKMRKHEVLLSTTGREQFGVETGGVNMETRGGMK